MRKFFKKRQNIFIKLIHDQAAFTLEGLEALKAYMAGDTAAAERLTNAEKQAKFLTDQTVKLAENSWKAASNQASSLWATATSIF